MNKIIIEYVKNNCFYFVTELKIMSNQNYISLFNTNTKLQYKHEARIYKPYNFARRLLCTKTFYKELLQSNKKFTNRITVNNRKLLMNEVFPEHRLSNKCYQAYLYKLLTLLIKPITMSYVNALFNKSDFDMCSTISILEFLVMTVNNNVVPENYNCKGCKNCKMCISCNYCKSCKACFFSDDLFKCELCISSRCLLYGIKCDHCINSVYLNVCKDVTDSFMCGHCTNVKYCYNVRVSDNCSMSTCVIGKSNIDNYDGLLNFKLKDKCKCIKCDKVTVCYKVINGRSFCEDCLIKHFKEAFKEEIKTHKIITDKVLCHRPDDHMFMKIFE